MICVALFGMVQKAENAFYKPPERCHSEPWYLVCDRRGEHALLRFYKARAWVAEMYGDKVAVQTLFMKVIGS
jgi:hypothetical protein